MTDKILSLDDIFAALPDASPAAAIRSSVDAKTKEAFGQINAFVQKFGREPMDDHTVEFEERSLAKKLKRIRAIAGMWETLRTEDEFDLLKDARNQDTEAPEVDGSENATSQHEAEEPSGTSSEPIIASDDELEGYDAPDDLEELMTALTEAENDDDSIFKLRHVRSYDRQMASADFTSQREKCPNFHEYEPLFEQVNKEIASGIREPLPFRKEQEIYQGQFFILNGLMVYIAEVGEAFEKNGKKNARLKTIFSNGTQGNNLLRSLATELYKDSNGRRISDPKTGGLFSNVAAENDIGTGTVYVLESLSLQPSVLPNRKILHKIGVTKGPVATRIANAEKEATYLLAPVKVVAEFEVFNIKARNIEKLLHAYFDTARAEITIKDRFGKPVQSREWFFAPVNAIKEAVDRLIDGTLGETFYDAKAGQIRPRQ
ncbi:GIY-YIG nuclease family protein [Sulfitobacter sp. SK011]|uniref:GIY-YIG nuclease family protein n=1 Tax=Sulfitobacter sp. SK011 TaxID=1389004 RepID=UPI000E09E6D7|nr:GIY-YIG nuclease family protein [Sulfitobacter sp. SK011]AXI43136.1 hypothetical protein C1J02_15235 [Sulfitobacter sp. SK011]